MPHDDEVRGPDAVQVLERALDKHGLRHTMQRRTILEVVARIGHPFSAGELTDEVAKADPSIGRASVFRLLQLLRSCSLVERLHGPDAELYTLCLAAGHHHHVTCTVCGRTEAFSLEDDDAVTRAVEKVGYRMEHHVLQAFGVCAGCQKTSAAEPKGAPRL